MPVNQPTYHLKENKTLDTLAVHVRATGTQSVYQAGVVTDPEHGGWIAGSGQIEISVNTPQIHHDRYGNLTGIRRDAQDGGHGIRYFITDMAVGDVVPENHRNFVNPDVAWNFHNIVTGTETLTLTLNVGETLHVCYGPEDVLFRKQGSSDGIIVYCISGLPEPRGGLWGTNRPGNYDVPLWNRVRQMVLDAEPGFSIEPPGKTFSGPAIGALPNPIQVDWQQLTSTNSNMNEQVGFMSAFLTHRGFQKIRDERNGGTYPAQGIADMQKIMDIALRATLCGSIDDDPNFQHNHGAFGWHAYPPQRVSSFMGLLVGIVALNITPNDERFNRILGHFAQVAPAHGTHHSARLLDNSTVNGGLAAHLNDNIYTQWLATTPEGTPPSSFGFRGSHEIQYLCVCLLARAILGIPLTPVLERLITLSGKSGNLLGHSMAPSGAGSGWEVFYCRTEIAGAMLLRVTRTHHQTTFVRYASRSLIAQPSTSTSVKENSWWSLVAQARWVEEVQGVAVSGTTSASLSWTALTGAVSYNIYRGTSETTLALVTNVAAPAVAHVDNPGDGTWVYAVSAVDADGNEGSHGDGESVTISGAAAAHEINLMQIPSPQRLNMLDNVVVLTDPQVHTISLLQVPSPHRLNRLTVNVEPVDPTDPVTAEASALWEAVTNSYNSTDLMSLTNIQSRSSQSVNTTVGQNAARGVIDLWPAYVQRVYDPNNVLDVEAAKQVVIALLWRRGGSSTSAQEVKWDEAVELMERLKNIGPRGHAAPSLGMLSGECPPQGQPFTSWADRKQLPRGILPSTGGRDCRSNGDF